MVFYRLRYVDLLGGLGVSHGTMSGVLLRRLPLLGTLKRGKRIRLVLAETGGGQETPQSMGLGRIGIDNRRFPRLQMHRLDLRGKGAELRNVLPRQRAKCRECEVVVRL